VSFARALSRAQLGLEAPLVHVEAHLGSGLPNFTIVGLPALVVRESRERVRAALLSSGYTFPPGRITVNLAPAELSKQGGRFDLPVALALLVATGQVPAPERPFECYGELGLAGELKPVAGLFLAALHARAAGHALIVPAGNGDEVAMSAHPACYGAATLRAAAKVLAGLAPECALAAPGAKDHGDVSGYFSPTSLAEVVGHWQAKRALIVAAAGAHSVLLIGPPGSGKSMLAARLPELLPPLSAGEALEVASIASTAGLRLNAGQWARRPFRCPHHSASAQAIVGGGPQIRPGEVTLAHHGVLFLDELPEFDRRVLESLREPLETGAITIARAAARLELPARFQLIAAMNPCPCGYFGDSARACVCGAARVARYRQRISGPLLDRIDLRIDVPRIAAAEFVDGALHSGVALESADAKVPIEETVAQIARAREWRLHRSGCLSARLDAAALQSCCALPRSAQQLLKNCAQRLALSGRGIHRVLTISRTIADLDGSETIEAPHLAEAVQLRRAFGDRLRDAPELAPKLTLPAIPYSRRPA
jgi:magnesium chelatase family protein